MNKPWLMGFSCNCPMLTCPNIASYMGMLEHEKTIPWNKSFKRAETVEPDMWNQLPWKSNSK
jgi:hypothetical protein